MRPCLLQVCFFGKERCDFQGDSAHFSSSFLVNLSVHVYVRVVHYYSEYRDEFIRTRLMSVVFCFLSFSSPAVLTKVPFVHFVPNLTFTLSDMCWTFCHGASCMLFLSSAPFYVHVRLLPGLNVFRAACNCFCVLGVVFDDLCSQVRMSSNELAPLAVRRERERIARRRIKEVQRNVSRNIHTEVLVPHRSSIAAHCVPWMDDSL